MIRAALAGGSETLRAAIAEALAGTDVELMGGPGLAGADVVLVAADDAASAEERCQALAGTLPCVLLHAPGTVDPDGRAAACGARATVEVPPDAGRLRRAVHLAGAGPAAGDGGAAGGSLVAVLAGSGGQGASTVVRGLALALPGPVALLDLDLAGGVQAALAGLEDDARDAGLPGEERGEDAFERLGRAVDFGVLVPAPPRPDLAWLVRDGVVAGACRASRRAHRWAVADVGRPLGPTVEAVLSADLLLVVTRLDDRALGATRRQLDRLDALALPAGRVAVVANAVRRRDAVRLHAAAGALGRPVDLTLPEAAPDAPAMRSALQAVPAWRDGVRGAA